MHSDLVSGPVTVGVQHSLSVKGVDFILGNDFAAENVMALPCMVNSLGGISDPSVDGDTIVVYPSCAVTRTMAKQACCNNAHDCAP